MYRFIRHQTSKLVMSTVVWVLALPLVARAADYIDKGLDNIDSVFNFKSKIAQSKTISELIGYILQLLLFVAGALAVLFVIIGGYQYLTSGGNEEQAEKGKKTLINSIIGIAVVILSWVIINVIIGTIG